MGSVVFKGRVFQRSKIRDKSVDNISPELWNKVVVPTYVPEWEREREKKGCRALVAQAGLQMAGWAVYDFKLGFIGLEC